MRKTLFLYSSILFVIVCFWCFHLRIKEKASKVPFPSSTARADSVLYKKTDSVKAQIAYIGKEIQSILKSVSDQQPDSWKSMLRALDTGPILVLYISESGCSTCINQQLEFLKSSERRFNKERIFIIGAYANPQSFKILLKSFEFDFKSLWVNSRLCDRKPNLPLLYFMLNSRLKVLSHFVPTLDQQLLTIKHLRTTAKGIFN